MDNRAQIIEKILEKTVEKIGEIKDRSILEHFEDFKTIFAHQLERLTKDSEYQEFILREAAVKAYGDDQIQETAAEDNKFIEEAVNIFLSDILAEFNIQESAKYEDYELKMLYESLLGD